MRQRIAKLLAVLLLVGFLPFIAAQNAEAVRTCDLSTGGNYFDGFWYNSAAYPDHYYEGASTFIVVQNGAVCSGDNTLSNFTNSWVMIAAGNGDGWAQVGFEHTAGYALRWFSQSSPSLGTYYTRYSTFSVASEEGVRHAFYVRWSPACYCERMTIDSTLWASSPFNPFTSWSLSKPMSPQYFGETGYFQDDVPGYSSNHTKFTSMGVQSYDDSSALIPCILSGRDDHPGRWSRDASSCTAFDIWTSVP
jgi:hypothetical protein